MLMNRENKVSMLRYWTTRYFITLCIGLIIIGIISFAWIQRSTTENRLDMMELIAEEVAERAVNEQGDIIIHPYLSRIVDRRQHMMNLDIKPFLFIFNQDKELIFNVPSIPIKHVIYPINQLLEDDRKVMRFQPTSEMNFYLIKRGIQHEGQSIGWVVMLYPEKEIKSNPEELKLLFIMLLSLAILGWGVMYLLTKRLSDPIRDVAGAANQIVSGDYDIHLKKDLKEKELFELVDSFKGMAHRLKKLESMRTELLAGVTHELKTPITSLNAMIQAVKDEVVTGDEAKEFLEISLKESNRLKKMVEDLLDFNIFASGSVKVNKENHHLNPLLREIIYQWELTQEESNIKLEVTLPESDIFVNTDALRLQQIMINLLNNAKQAMNDVGIIEIKLHETPHDILIDVKDQGTGIPKEEQALIFERFYRGKDKQSQKRGLGLGLTFSKMMAKSLGGDLVLKESSSLGSTFTLILSKDNH